MYGREGDGWRPDYRGGERDEEAGGVVGFVAGLGFGVWGRGSEVCVDMISGSRGGRYGDGIGWGGGTNHVKSKRIRSMY